MTEEIAGTEVRLVASASLPTPYGEFRIVGFVDELDGKEHTAVINGGVEDAVECPVRVHSECHTGDIFHSLRCDCGAQLEASLELISRAGKGVVIYLKQEGRGIGLLNKIRAYQLQDMGMDTVDANEHLGFPGDMRDYRVASRIISLLGIRSVALLTNNPSKIDGLRAYGISVVRRIPVTIAPNTYNARYLRTKQVRMGHLFEIEDGRAW